MPVPMIVARTVPELRQALSPLRERGPVGFVPTMGALHEGHLSLIRRAREESAVVVVSIFVNPLQFGPEEDFSRYPRPLEKDLALLRQEAVEVVFCPDPAEFTPAESSTAVTVGGVSEGQEGAVRPGHFSGVATIVAKLFNAVGPDLAVFGRKDLQQAAVIRRMIRDLGFPVRLVVAPISREEDGLARSSRNIFLSPEERCRAAALPRALREGRRSLLGGGPVASVEAEIRRRLEGSGLGVDYVEVVDPDTMKPVSGDAGERALAAAVRIGKVRLLDNVFLGCPGTDGAGMGRGR